MKKSDLLKEIEHWKEMYKQAMDEAATVKAQRDAYWLLVEMNDNSLRAILEQTDNLIKSNQEVRAKRDARAKAKEGAQT